MSKNSGSRRCFECNAALTLERATIEYPESGLDHVRLFNVPVWRCANGHEDVELPAVDELHDLLADMVVRKRGLLSGKEVRFLRKRLELSGRQFSRLIGLTPEHLSMIEHRQAPLRRRVDLLVRLVSALALAEKRKTPPPADLMPILEQLESMSERDLQLTHIAGGRTAQEWREVR